MKKVILLLVGLVGAFVLFHVGRGFLDAVAHDGSPAARERRLIQISKAMNQGLPRDAGEETRLERTTAGPGLRFTYVYKFINRSAAEVDPAKLTTVVRSKVTSRYKTSPEMANFRKWQVELHYKYYGKDGGDIATIVVAANDL